MVPTAPILLYSGRRSASQDDRRVRTPAYPPCHIAQLSSSGWANKSTVDRAARESTLHLLSDEPIIPSRGKGWYPTYTMGNTSSRSSERRSQASEPDMTAAKPGFTKPPPGHKAPPGYKWTGRGYERRTGWRAPSSGRGRSGSFGHGDGGSSGDGGGGGGGDGGCS